MENLTILEALTAKNQAVLSRIKSDGILPRAVYKCECPESGDCIQLSFQYKDLYTKNGILSINAFGEYNYEYHDGIPLGTEDSFIVYGWDRNMEEGFSIQFTTGYDS